LSTYICKLLLFTETFEFLYASVDAFGNEGEDRIISIVHLTLFESLESQFEHISLNFFFVVSVSFVERAEDITEHLIDDFALIDFFKSLGLFENVDSTTVYVIL
jgi:hypothetical protein